MNLKQIGWNSFFQRAFQKNQSGLTPARIVGVYGRAFGAITEVGVIRCFATSLMEAPAVGDWVGIDSEHRVQMILPRKSRLSRKVAGEESREQLIAANVDHVVIVQGLDNNFNPRRLERYLAMVAESGANSLVVLTKSDLCQDTQAKLAEIRSVSPSAITASGITGEGLTTLREMVKDSTSAFVGSSGVGKSTLINALLGESKQATATVRSDSKGRHTTTSRQMFFLPEGGAIIDNPGMRELQLWTTPTSVDAVFQDIAEIALDCRFRDCTHMKEPQCAVRRALDSGSLDQARFDSYSKLLREAENLRVAQDPVAQSQKKASVKALHRFIRNVSETKRKYRTGI